MNLKHLIQILFIILFYSSKIKAQTNDCVLLIPELNLCPGSTNLEVRGSDNLVSETDGSELIYNTNGRLISVAGWDGVGLAHNRIRYSDDNGFTWVGAANGPFAPRHTFSMIEDDGYFYLIGGDFENTVDERKEVWKSPNSDGLNWTLHTTDTPFGDQVLYQVVKYNSNWYAIGGQHTSNGVIEPIPLRKVFVSYNKGINWTLLNEGIMPPIGLTWACTTVFKNKVWIVAGGTYNAGAIVSNKAYSTSDFVTWTEEADFIYPAGTMWNRVFAKGDYIFTHCGYQVYYSDVNYTFASRDGKIWVDITNPQTTTCHATAVATFQNGFISNQPFSGNQGSLGVFHYNINNYQKCFTNTTFTNDAGDSLWSNPLNWSRGTPGIKHYAEIRENETCNFDLTNISIGKLKIEENATLNLYNDFKIIKSDTFGLRNFGNINLFHGNFEIDSILGDGIVNTGSINVLGDAFIKIRNIGCKGIRNLYGGTLNENSQQNLVLSLNDINKTGFLNLGLTIFRGNVTFTQLNGNAIENQGVFINYGNVFLDCNLINDTYHIINNGIFSNQSTLTGHSKFGMKNLGQGTFDNFGTVNNYGGLSIDGMFSNRSNAQFFNY